MYNDCYREKLGYDIDGELVEELRVLRYPFSSFIENWDLEPNVDPRLYCAIKGLDGNAYLVSVYDHWNKSYIRRYENLKEDEPIPMKVLPISDASHYEVAFSGINGDCWYYEFDKNELKRKLNKYIKENKPKTKKLKK